MIYEDDSRDIRYYNNRINELKNQIEVIKIKIEREKNNSHEIKIYSLFFIIN